MTCRLLASYVSVILLVLVLLEVPLGFVFAREERRRLESDVQHDAFALALRSEEQMENRSAPDALRQLQALADRYRRENDGRGRFVDAAGTLLADGDPPAGHATDETRNFAGRPEIRQALQGRDVTGTRSSRTLGTDLLYVALPIATGGVLHGAVRVTYPLSYVNARVRDNWLVLGAVGASVLLIVLLVSIALARSLSRPIGRLERGAEALGHGHLDERVDVPRGPHELRALAYSFNTTAARLEQLVGAQQAFVADASHQLRTPLAALRLRLENLGGDVTPEGREDLAGAVEEVGRLSRLVDGLLELARAEQHGTHPEPVPLRALLEGRRDAWSALAEERGVRLEVLVDDSSVLATPGRLEQVIDNLLNNALEVVPTDSAIRLSAARAGDEVRLHVSDAGPGMTAEQRSRAFDRFWRSGSGEGGFGLGLAIVHQLVVADGGTVRLGASEEGGLDVALSLPTARPEPASESANAHATPR